MAEKTLEQMKEAVAEIRAKMAAAAREAGRDPATVQLCAACKTRTAQTVAASAALPIDVFGENHVQELCANFDAGAYCGKPSHFIGHLQTNKAKQAVKYFSLIHSVDTEHLARALDKEARKVGKCQDILVQVNLAKEDSKSGIYKENLRPLLDLVDELPNLRLRGLMCIAPNYDDVEKCRPLFHEMYEIFQQVKEIPFKTANISYLSMGMTHDYQIAVEEGANIVRVGTAIFGPRQY